MQLINKRFDLNLLRYILTSTIILLFLSCDYHVNSASKAVPPTNLKPEEVYEHPEEVAILSVCENELNPQSCSNQKFIALIYKNIKFNESVTHTETTLKISFVIEKDGSLTSIETLRGKSTIEQSNLTQLLNEMPKWIPGKVGGEVVRSNLTLPIKIHYD